MSDLGLDLMRQRHRIGMTQAELADWAGISAVSVWAIESGRRRPRKTTLAKIRHALLRAGCDRGRIADATHGHRCLHCGVQFICDAPCHDHRQEPCPRCLERMCDDAVKRRGRYLKGVRPMLIRAVHKMAARR